MRLSIQRFPIYGRLQTVLPKEKRLRNLEFRVQGGSRSHMPSLRLAREGRPISVLTTRRLSRRRRAATDPLFVRPRSSARGSDGRRPRRAEGSLRSPPLPDRRVRQPRAENIGGYDHIRRSASRSSSDQFVVADRGTGGSDGPVAGIDEQSGPRKPLDDIAVLRLDPQRRRSAGDGSVEDRELVLVRGHEHMSPSQASASRVPGADPSTESPAAQWPYRRDRRRPGSWWFEGPKGAASDSVGKQCFRTS